MHESNYLSATQTKSRSSADSFIRSADNLSKGKSFYRPSFPDIFSSEKPVSQFKLRSRKSFTSSLEQNDRQQNDLDEIADELVLYNQIDPSTDLQFQKRLGQLKSLEEIVYAWFANHATKKLDNVDNTLFLKTFLDEIKQEHQSMIAQIAVTPDALPVDVSNLDKKERTKVRKVWKSLLNNSGNLQIRDDGKGFKDQMLAAFAKLLEGEFGRNLLTDVNMNRGGGEQRIIVAPSFKNKLGAKEKAESEAIPRSQIVPGRESENDLHGSSKNNKRTDLPEYTKKGEDFEPEEFHDFLTENHGSGGLFKFGNDAYKKGKGIGSFVRIVPDNSYSIGLNEEQILMPEYITLGHELGHAQRILRGAPLHSIDFEDFGVTDDVDKKLWNNPEEYVNINAVENRLRDEHSLPNRKYHAGDQKTLTFEKNFIDFRNRINELRDSLGEPVKSLFAYTIKGEKLINYLNVKPDYSSKSVMKRLNKELEQMRQDTNSASVMWQRVTAYLRANDAHAKTVFGKKMTEVMPFIDGGFIQNLSTEVVNAMVVNCIHNRNWDHVGKIVSWMQAKSNFSPMKPHIKTIFNMGGLIPLFEAGLTEKEFEKELDPNTEINVEIEYKKINPSAWFFNRVESIVYVRKKMKQ